MGKQLSFVEKLKTIDWIGTTLCVGMVVSLLLPLQWGGVTRPWNDGGVIACFVVVSSFGSLLWSMALTLLLPQFGVLLISFVSFEWYKGDSASMPLSLWKRRTQIGCCVEAVSASNSRRSPN